MGGQLGDDMCVCAVRRMEGKPLMLGRNLEKKKQRWGGGADDLGLLGFFLSFFFLFCFCFVKMKDKWGLSLLGYGLGRPSSKWTGS